MLLETDGDRDDADGVACALLGDREDSCSCRCEAELGDPIGCTSEGEVMGWRATEGKDVLIDANMAET